jgi:L-fuculose-phosphate aldolase
VNNAEIKEKIVEVARTMYERRMVNAYEGNISARAGDRVYITPSGICKGILTPDMLVAADYSGNILEGNKPSTELTMHLKIYELRPDVTAMIHTHPTYATAFALARKPIETRGYAEPVILFGKIPVADYGTPGTEKITAGFQKVIYDTDVFLLANHGLIAYGTDLTDIFYTVEAVEKTAKTLLFARLIGGETELSSEELEELHVLHRKLTGKN